MLRTKRVNVYGRKGTRIVQVSEDKHGFSDSPLAKCRNDQENTVSASPPSARKHPTRKRKVHKISTSPRGSPKSANIFGLRTKKVMGDFVAITPRTPLGVKNVSLASSPSIVYLGRKPLPQTPHVKNTAFAPYKDSDVVLLGQRPVNFINATKKAEKAEKRKKVQLKPTQLTNRDTHDVEELETIQPPRRRVTKRPIILSDDDDTDEDSPEITFQRSTRGTKADPIVVLGDNSDAPPAVSEREIHSDSESDSLLELVIKTKKQRIRQTRGYHRRQAEIPVPISLTSPATHQPFESSKTLGELVKRRPYKAMRTDEKQKPSGYTSKLEESFAALSISENIGADIPFSQLTHRPSRTLSGPRDKRASQPGAHLIPLLRECGQTSPYSFSAFVETFPSDSIHENHVLEPLTFRKIGEASFSEVFAIGNIVLKVIPLRDESASASTRLLDEDVDLPQESESKDVLQEVIVTRTLGQACRGFVKLLKTYIVVGEYPSLLLSLWDEFNDKKPSENIRPDVFPPSQAYALLVLPNGGSDLETYIFPPKVGWQQACSIFWQTAKALALAEDLLSFEHRDLHWGQILVKAVGTTRKEPRALQRGQRKSNPNDITMDHPSHGVVTTIIDLGLARMEAADSSGISLHWTPLDELIFQGEGDYQFDIYRMMKQVHGDRWDRYRPLTNVMWLHYLSLKLLRGKRLRAPNLRGVTAVSNEFGEKPCYECMVEMEALLGSSIPRTKDKAKRGDTIKGFFQNARDVVNFAQGRGWLQR